MTTYTLKRISRTPKVSKATGKPYVSVGIQVAEFGETWINGFGNKTNELWKEGGSIEVEMKDNEYNGKVSKQFDMPKNSRSGAQEGTANSFPSEAILTKLQVMQNSIDKLLALHTPKIKESEMITSDGRPVPFPTDIDVQEDVPW